MHELKTQRGFFKGSIDGMFAASGTTSGPSKATSGTAKSKGRGRGPRRRQGLREVSRRSVNDHSTSARAASLATTSSHGRTTAHCLDCSRLGRRRCDPKCPKAGRGFKRLAGAHVGMLPGHACTAFPSSVQAEASGVFVISLSGGESIADTGCPRAVADVDWLRNFHGQVASLGVPCRGARGSSCSRAPWRNCHGWASMTWSSSSSLAFGAIGCGEACPEECRNEILMKPFGIAFRASTRCSMYVQVFGSHEHDREEPREEVPRPPLNMIRELARTLRFSGCTARCRRTRSWRSFTSPCLGIVRDSAWRSSQASRSSRRCFGLRRAGFQVSLGADIEGMEKFAARPDGRRGVPRRKTFLTLNSAGDIGALYEEYETATLGLRLPFVSAPEELVALIYVFDEDYATSPVVCRRPREGAADGLGSVGSTMLRAEAAPARRRHNGGGGSRDARLRDSRSVRRGRQGRRGGTNRRGRETVGVAGTARTRSARDLE